MDDLKNQILEKSINFWIRNILRFMAWVVLIFYMVYRIIMPLIAKEPLYLDSNDGWVIFGCMCLLLAIEAVRAYAKRRLDKLD